MTSKYLRFNTLLKGTILAATFIFLYFKLKSKESDLSHLITLTGDSIQDNFIQLLLICILMPLNWSLEALKWQVLASKVLRLDFFRAFRGVISGLGLSFWTPHGVGDYIGRIGQITHQDRKRLVGPILLGRLMQMLTTLIFGVIGVYYLLGVMYFLYLTAVTIIGIVLIVLSKRFIKNHLHFKIREFIYPYIHLIWSFSLSDSAKLLGLSVLRYLVFSGQFLLAIHLFLPELDIMLKIAGITWVFLIKSILPTFNFLSDLGIREFSAVLFFENYSAPVEPVILASLLIWVINILTPTVVSLPLIWKLKLSR